MVLAPAILNCLINCLKYEAMEIPQDIQEMPIREVIRRICKLNDEIQDFWSDAHGWAPSDAASLLSRSRLDRQVSLSYCLDPWSGDVHPPERQDGALILGWANLGSLVEGSMKWFLSVYREDYPEDETAFRRKGKLLEPESLMLDQLRRFFTTHVWTDSECMEWDSWLTTVRDRRNAVHSYKDYDIGDLDGLHYGIRMYLAFLRTLEGRVPYPDEGYRPYEYLDDF